MANRRSNSTRTGSQIPSRPSAVSSNPAASAAPPRTVAQRPAAVASPANATGAASTQTPGESPGKSAAKAAPRRARQAKADPAPRKVAVSDEQRLAMIAQAAYFHAERRAFAPGGEVEDWLAAEAEVDALLKAAGGTPQ